MQPGDYWKLVAAPKIRARKRVLGRARSNASLAEAIELASGKRTGRGLFEHFMRGTREPYISQVVAMCSVMEVPLQEILQPAIPTIAKQPLIRVRERKNLSGVIPKKVRNRIAR